MTIEELMDWLRRSDGRLQDIFALWVQGKRDDRWVAEKLIGEGHLDALPAATPSPDAATGPIPGHDSFTRGATPSPDAAHDEDCHNRTHIRLDDALDEIERLRATPSPDAGRMTEALAAMAPLFHEYAIDAAEADWPDVHPGVSWDLCPDDLCAKARRLLGKDGDQEMERLAAR